MQNEDNPKATPKNKKGLPYKIGKETYYCPTSFEQVSVRTFLRIQYEWDNEVNDLIHLFCILTDYDFEKMSNAKIKPGFESDIVKGISWVFEERVLWGKLVPKDFLNINGRMVEIPKDIGEESLGQKMAIAQLGGSEEQYLKLIPWIIAIYLDPHYHEADKPYEDRKFNKKRAMEFKKVIDELPILECYPIAFFFSNNSKNSRNSGRDFLNLIQRFRTTISESLQMKGLRQRIGLNSKT